MFHLSSSLLQQVLSPPSWRRLRLALIGILPVCLAACGASLNDETGIGAGLAPAADSGKVASDSKPDAAATGAIRPVRLEEADALMATGTPGNSAYKIGPQDVLEVSVFKVPELSRSVQVADVGTVNLPLVGEVPVVGKTAREVEHDLTEKLGDKYLQSPQVTVYVKEYNSRRVTIEGSVRKPGVYPIRGRTTLLQFVSIAQGVTEASDTGNIVVFRTTDGKRSAARFDLDDIREGTAPDPEITDGDVIVVNASPTKAAFQNLLRAIPVTSAFIPLL